MPIPTNTSTIDPLTGFAVPANTGTWANLSGLSWSNWTEWSNRKANVMIVVSEVQDRGQTGYFNLKTDVDVTGNITYSVYTSNTGAFAGEETVSTITPNTGNIAAFVGRYYTVVANVSDPSGEIQLRSFNITSTNSRFDIQFNDLETSSLALGPNNSGSRVLPLPRVISAVTNMQVTSHNPSIQNSIYITTGNTGYVLDYNSTISTVTTQNISASPTYSNYIMVGTKETPFNYVYKTNNGDTWSNLSVVSNTGGSYSESVDWNLDGTKVVFGLENPSSNNLRVYSRSGDTFTKETDVNTWPAGGVHDVAWTNTDDDFIAVAHDNSPYVSIYAGNNYNKQSNPATLPTGSAFSVAFSPADDFLAVGHQTSPYITIYSRSGGTFTKLSDPASLPNNTVIDLTWSPDGTYLVAAYGQTFKIYYRTGSTFIAINDPAIVPDLVTGTFVMDWNPGGNAVAIGWSSALEDANDTTDFGVYRTQGNTWTWANTAATTISGSIGVYDLEWMAGGNQLIIGHHNTTANANGVKVYNFTYSGNVLTQSVGFDSNVGNVYAVAASVASDNNFLAVANVAGFPASGTIRVRNETMSYTSANATTNRFENITRAVTTTTFGASTANAHAAGSEVFAVDNIDFSVRYFAEEPVGISNAYVNEKDRVLPTVVVRDAEGQYTDGVIDAVLWVMPEQFMDDTNLGTR